MRLNGLLFILLATQLCGLAYADIAQTIAQVKPSVLIVGTFKATGNPRFALRGTGFVVSDGKLGVSNLFVTNAHVLVQVADEEADTALVVQVKGGKDEWQMRAATVLDVDKVHDLALLRFEGAALPSLNISDSASVREGQSVAFMGFPIGGALGFSPVTHRGFISSIAAVALPTPTAQQLNSKVIRSLRSGISFDIFQLDGTAYPGNSGGPLFDPATGNVLGVLNMVFIKGTRESALTHPSGISYAIPSEHIKQLLLRQGAQ
jgi:S1-C subfamily serine protease